MYIFQNYLQKQAKFYSEECLKYDNSDYNKKDLEKIKSLIEKYEDVKKLYNNKDFLRIEPIANKILIQCYDFTDMKIIYIETLLELNKPCDAISFLKNMLNDDERNLDCFHYFESKAHYFNSH